MISNRGDDLSPKMMIFFRFDINRCLKNLIALIDQRESVLVTFLRRVGEIDIQNNYNILM